MIAQNKRSLHVINGEHYSGGERVQDILGMTLPKYGYDVDFVCLAPDMFPKNYRSKSCRIYSVPMKSRIDLNSYRKLADIVKKGGYHIIHSHMPRTAPVARLASFACKTPMVHHIHSTTFTEGPNIVINILAGFLERISLAGVDKVIPCSEGMAVYARRIGIPNKNISVALNGIPTIGPVSMKSKPSDEWVFGMVALFRPRKGIEVLFEAMHILNKRGYRINLKAIGGFFSAKYETDMKQYANRLGIDSQIDWIGFKKDVGEELRKLDGFVLPSLKGEGLPIALLEAMSAGLPSITTDIPGSNEVLREGVDGYYCKPGNPESLADAMEKLIAHPERWLKISKNAYSRQLSSFSDDSMASAVAAIYDQVLA